MKKTRKWVSRKVFNDKEVEELKANLFKKYCESDLAVLEGALIVNRSKLQRQQSKREVWLAFWKSSPYFLIALSTASVASWFGWLGDFQAMIPGIFLVSIIILTVLSYFISGRIDRKIAILELESDVISKYIREREIIVRNSLLVMKKVAKQGPIRFYRQLYFEDDVLSKKVPRIEAVLGKGHKDVELRYPLLYSDYNKLKEISDQYIEKATQFREDGMKMLSEIDKKCNIKDQPQERYSAILKAIIGIASKKVDSIEVLKKLRNQMDNRECHWHEMLLSSDTSKLVILIGEMIQNEDIISISKEIRDLNERGESILYEIETRIAYLVS